MKPREKRGKNKRKKKEKRDEKKREASMRFSPSRDGPNFFFFERNVKRNRLEIEAKKTDFEHPRRKNKEKR